jgi:two-component system sensor histidine kinase PilS (NtrC family)
MADTATSTEWAPATPPGVRGPLRAVLRGFTRDGLSEMAVRALRLTDYFRLFVALALPATTLFVTEPTLLASGDLPAYLTVAGLYAAAAMIFLLWRRGATRAHLVPLAVTTDIVGVTLLTGYSGGVSSGVAGLLVVFVGAASLALTGRYALFAAAVAALSVLGQQSLLFLAGTTAANEFVSAGMIGAIILMTAAVANPLAVRLQESEALAHQRGIDLANLAQLNDYVVQNLRESIVVVDAENRVRLMNEPAAEVLGARSRHAGQPLQRVSGELERVLGAWRSGA